MRRTNIVNLLFAIRSNLKSFNVTKCTHLARDDEHILSENHYRSPQINILEHIIRSEDE